MTDLAGFDWEGYFRNLQDDEARALAIWLATEGLGLGELMEIVDRAYAALPGAWQGQPGLFVARVGQPAARGYARRKRFFAALMATFEEALVRGALPGDVAPHELRLIASPWTKPRQPEELLGTLQHARGGPS